mgnify:CR=1 FL=1
MLLAGIAAVSFASIFIRYAQNEGVPSLVIAAGRLIVASAILLPVVLSRHQQDIRHLKPRDWMFILIAGFFLAIHFASWVTSLEYTAVLISVVLVTTGPIWVALLEVIFLKTRMGFWVIVGIAIAVLGGVVIGTSGSQTGVTMDLNTLIGGGLALLGALTVSVYVVIGRELRPRVAVVPYIWLVYSAAALFLAVTLLMTQTPVTGYSAQGYLWILVMGLVPQLIGHSSFNYALGYLPATLVSIATQVEPVGSAVAAFFLFSEVPTFAQLTGSLTLVIGVVIAIWGQSRTARA